MELCEECGYGNPQQTSKHEERQLIPSGYLLCHIECTKVGSSYEKFGGFSIVMVQSGCQYNEQSLSYNILFFDAHHPDIFYNGFWNFNSDMNNSDLTILLCHYFPIYSETSILCSLNLHFPSI